MEGIFVTQISENHELPAKLEEHLKGFSLYKVKLGGLSQIRIAKFTKDDKKNTFLAGHLLYKEKKASWDYNITNLDNNPDIEYLDRTQYFPVEITFTIFPTLKIIVFNNRQNAIRSGMKILSHILFGSGNVLKSARFFPSKILSAKKKGHFSNVWYNGVHGQGKIRSTNQHGDDIDTDPEFLNKTSRYGLGVEIDSDYGPVKVAIYTTGSIVYLGSLKNFKHISELRHSILKKFKPYSSYN